GNKIDAVCTQRCKGLENITSASTFFSGSWRRFSFPCSLKGTSVQPIYCFFSFARVKPWRNNDITKLLAIRLFRLLLLHHLRGLHSFHRKQFLFFVLYKDN